MAYATGSLSNFQLDSDPKKKVLRMSQDGPAGSYGKFCTVTPARSMYN